MHSGWAVEVDLKTELNRENYLGGITHMEKVTQNNRTFFNNERHTDK